MKKYPFVKQQSSKTCGVASLSMIIKYYNGNIDNNYLLELTKTNKEGTTAYHLVEGAKTLGFESKGLKVSLDDLNKILLPCIAHTIINKTFNHYVVIYEINYKNKYLIIADPATKLKRMSFSEFQEIWTGVVLTFKPVKQIPIINNEITIKKFIFNLINIHKRSLIPLFILSMLITLFALISSFSFKLMIDNVMDMQTKGYLYVIFMIFVIIIIAKICFNHTRSKILIFLSQKIDWQLTNDIFSKIINLPYHYYRKNTTGDIVSRISDLKTLKDVIGKTILTLFVDIPLTLFSSISLYFINPKLFIISIFIFLIYFIVIFIFKPIYKELISNIHKKNALVNSYMVENISAFETIKGLGIEDETNKQFKKHYYDLTESSLKLGKVFNIQTSIKSIIDEVGTLVILFVGSLLVLDSKITIGSLIAFNSLLVYFTSPLKNIVDMDSNLKEAKDALSRILEILIKKDNIGKLYHNELHNIEYKNLSYSYDDYNLVLSNINLEIKNKEKILIIGDSGSGKSTLLKLLMKFHKVKRNCLFIDNIDINDYSEECIKDNICYISQNEMLFTDSLYNNLCLNCDVSDDKVEEVLNLCYIKDIFKSSNLGINMLIEENGFNLSGGEKQRIVLGRTLLRPFNILIIDEGLNQVDISLERKILKNILKKYKDKTIIVISHRLENMDLFSRVIKFKHTEIEEGVRRNG